MKLRTTYNVLSKVKELAQLNLVYIQVTVKTIICEVITIPLPVSLLNVDAS